MSGPVCFQAPWDYPDAAALQALARGEARPDQQRRALDWVVKTAAGTYQTSFVPGAPDASAFAEGRRFVGLQVVKLLSLNLEAIRNAQQEKTND